MELLLLLLLHGWLLLRLLRLWLSLLRLLISWLLCLQVSLWLWRLLLLDGLLLCASNGHVRVALYLLGLALGAIRSCPDTPVGIHTLVLLRLLGQPLSRIHSSC